MKIRGVEFKNFTYIMAIINLTPDSFFSDSRAGVDDVLFRVEKAIKDGAAVIDLGAQSTRPNYKEVSPDGEFARLEKPLEAVRARFDVPISIDTYFSSVAKNALLHGADMINDIWGLTHDSDMAEVIAAANASVCIMHNSKSPLVGDIFPQIKSFLSASAERALTAGIDRDKICLDGGVGFAKDRAQNLELIENYSKLSDLGYPLLLGASRKSVFGGRVEDRLDATLASTRHAAKNGLLFVRVHDVRENYQAVKEIYERN